MSLPKPDRRWTPGYTMAARHRLELGYLAELRRLIRDSDHAKASWGELGVSYAQVKEVLDENEGASTMELVEAMMSALGTRVRTQATIDYNRSQWDAMPDGFSKRWVCITPESRVSARSVKAAARRHYVGPVITVRTASGSMCTLTPDHRVLTGRGWVRAEQLDLTDYVFKVLRTDTPRAPHVGDLPPQIGEVVDAAMASEAVEVWPMGIGMDFDGEQPLDGQVQVVGSNGELFSQIEASFPKSVGDFSLTPADVLAEVVHFGRGDLAALLEALTGTPISLSEAELPSLPNLRRVSGGAEQSGFGPIADRDSVQFEVSTDGGGSAAVPFSEEFQGVTGQVFFDDLVDIEVGSWSGHVYDLSTEEGWFLSDDLIIHNCRHDPKTRHAHLKLDGTTLKKWQPFRSGGYSLQYPGDPSAPPELTFNCRCVVIPVQPPNLTASAFAFNPDQWRNPLNGRWIDMPWTVLTRLFRQINPPFVSITPLVGTREYLPAPGDYSEEDAPNLTWYSEMRFLYRKVAEWRKNPTLTTGELAEGIGEVLRSLDTLRYQVPRLRLLEVNNRRGDLPETRAEYQEQMESHLEDAIYSLDSVQQDLWRLPDTEFRPFVDTEPRIYRDMIAGQALNYSEQFTELSTRMSNDPVRADIQELARELAVYSASPDNLDQWDQVKFLSDVLGLNLGRDEFRDGATADLQAELRAWLYAASDIEDGLFTAHLDKVAVAYLAGRPGEIDLTPEERTAIGSFQGADRGLLYLHRGEPVSLMDAALLANVGEYLVNCQKAVLAYEAMRRGYADAIAGGTTGGSIGVTSEVTGEAQKLYVEMSSSAFGVVGMARTVKSTVLFTNTRPEDQLDALLYEMGTWPVGARGQLVVSWGSGAGHIVALEKLVDGTLVVVDPQIHKVMPVKEYLSAVQSVRSAIRTDDLELVQGKFLGEDQEAGTLNLGDSRIADTLHQLLSGKLPEREAVAAGFSLLGRELGHRPHQRMPRVSDGQRFAYVRDDHQRKVNVQMPGRELERRPNRSHVLGQELRSIEGPIDVGNGDVTRFGSFQHAFSIRPGQELAARTAVFKYNQAQLRIPKGNGKLSGRWMDSPFTLISALVRSWADRTGVDPEMLNYDWPEPNMRPMQEGDAAILLERYKVKIPPSWVDVQVDLEGKGGRIVSAKYVDRQGKVQPKSVYSAEHTAIQEAVKYNRVKALTEKIDDLKAGLEKIEGDPTTAALRLMFLYGVRVGSTDEQRGQVKAYGTTTLRMEHLSKNADGTMQLSFIAKEGIPASYTVDDPELVSYFEDRLNSGETGDSYIFATNSTKTQDRLKELTGIPYVKNHDLRTLLANVLAAQAGLKAESPTNKKEFNALRTAIATEVAAALRNKPIQAQKSYITPAVFELIEWAERKAAS